MKNQIAKISPELLEMMGSKLPNSLQPFSREIFLLDRYYTLSKDR